MSSHSVAAAARIVTESASSPIASMPAAAGFISVPSKRRVNSMLLPPPNAYHTSGLPRPKTASRSSALSNSMRRAAVSSTWKLLRLKSGASVVSRIIRRLPFAFLFVYLPQQFRDGGLQLFVASLDNGFGRVGHLDVGLELLVLEV